MSFIQSEYIGQVLKITLNRPDKFNSFNRAMALDLQSALDKASSEKKIRAVLLTGAGKAFCAGQDLSEAMDPAGPGIERIVQEHYNPIILKIRNLEKPVVCAVNGVAAGAGANIALACDVVLAAASASFIQAFSKIGLIPDSAGTFFLPRLIGFGRASALMMLGDKVPAGAMPTKGLGLTKRLLNKSLFNSLEDQLEEEGLAQVLAARTYDYGEGVKAFLEKRKPEFKGE
jgi:2-(1,2-epoxy-1,2-dihydrophenyl)acetyl-CoA isomerase